MKRPLYILTTIILVLTAVACQEQDEENEFDNWKERNEHYIDSLANVARNGSGWVMMKSFNLGDSLGTDGKNDQYIYVQKIESGTGTYHPLFNDSVRVHYSGHLLPSASFPQGYCFDKSFTGSEFNTATDVPTLLGVNNLVRGFSTAVMNMVEGDHWKVVIPYHLGYKEASDVVPAYSTLIFDIYLARVYRYQVDKNTEWY